MRYEGEEIVININYGTRFFLKSVDELEQELQTAKNVGASEGFILSLIEEIIDTKYKNSPSEAKKQKILLALDPFPSMDIKAVAELVKLGIPINNVKKLKEQIKSLTQLKLDSNGGNQQTNNNENSNQA